jgi:tetratricopeptide (TPR) repeat protein
MLGLRARASPIKTWSVVCSFVVCIGLTSAATANDSDTFRELAMFGEWAPDCRLPPAPTNQHINFMPSDNGEVRSLTSNGVREFPGIARNVKIISATRVGWRATVNGTTTDVIIERNGSRYRGLESVHSDGKILVKNGFMVEQGFGAPWLEKCVSPSATNVSAQAMLDTYRDCSGRDHDRAIRGCTELIRVQPASPYAYYYRSLAFQAAGQREKAITDVTESIRLDPQYAVAYNARAWMRFEAKQLTQGLADVQRSLDLSADDAASLDTRAHIYETLGRREDAIADYKRVLALLPERHSQAQPTRDALKRLGAPVQ